ncbi:MAG: CRISPR-associated endonuclease Cas1 [Pirellulaceae bacterium]|nr:CRISPR-associated endonuclease Cas1 [Pirellulaceae bacterium]
MIRISDIQSADELLPARMLNEFVYCPRLFYLEHVDGLFAHNSDTLEGAARHSRVDAKSDALPTAQEAVQCESIHARSVTLSSEQYGLIAKLDLIEAEGDLATPVDYKRGAPKSLDDGSLGAWDPDRIQLCVQALVLRENGYRCDEGILFYWATRQRVRITIDDALVAETLAIVAAARRLMDARQIPAPLVNSPKCPRCSLVSICLPDETSHCRAYVACEQSEQTQPGGRWVQPLLFDVGYPAANSESIESAPVRQLITSRDERRPLYLNTQGNHVGISAQVLKIKEKDKLIQEVRLNDLCQVNIFGNIQLTTQAIGALMTADIPVVYFSYGGWFHGMTQSVGLKNILWRREQFRQADSNRFCLQLAKQLVKGKIRNQRTLLMRNHVEPPEQALQFLKALTIEVRRAESLAELLGVEGLAARVYFEHFNGMIKVGSDDDRPRQQNGKHEFRFDFERRNRRPPRDPINALLSLGYSLLAKDLTIAATSVGLDPFLGFYHQPRFGRPALALDLMEPFRPLIVDSAVLSAINQRMVTISDFVVVGDAVALTANGRKGFFRAYEQRMDQLVTHPLFGYRVSYRRLLEVQTRLLARQLMGEILEYPVFETR